MNFECILNKIKIYQKEYQHLVFESDIEDVSCKVYITTKKKLKKNKEIYGGEINIFNKTIDYTLINYGGDVVDHKFYENYNDEIISMLFKTTIDELL